MWVGVLGPTVFRLPAEDKGTRTLPAAKHRALVAALALQAGRPVSADLLVEALWGSDAPPSAAATLHTYVSVVRRTLEPDLPARAPSRYLVSSDLGYELRLGDDGLDAARFARTVNEVHAELGPLATVVAPRTDNPAAAALAAHRLDEVLALWRGEPYADVVGIDAVAAERARLADLRQLALEDRATLLIASGATGSVASELEALTAQHPLRERLWTLLAVALARTGRQADALATLERLRHTLDEQLGIEPSPAVRELQTAILRQEPAVSSRGEVAPPAASAPVSDPVVSVSAVPSVNLGVPDWPLVGREEQVDVLDKLLTGAEGGIPAFATLVGEPGAGKSRLATELCLRARAAGATVLVGRCSEDEDAPPLWPWTTALGGGLPEPTKAATEDHDAARFAVADALCCALLDLAAARTVVLVLEDLHWADPSSLRVLRHLCGHAQSGQLLVVCTWRRGEIDEPLTEAAEALARRHATRLDIEGLCESDAHEVLAAVAGRDVDAAVATAAHKRTEGNAFFLIEYARLARDENRALADVLGGMPHTVSDVVRRRIRQLPGASADALRAGAVIGREFSIDLLARELDVTEAQALDLLEPALGVDLVRDLGNDRFRFWHALVRDTVYAELTPSRRQRMHASLAELIASASRPDQRAPEIARHWAAAGDRHVRKAWRAAAHAARLAMAAHAAEEAATHYRSALELLARDPEATPRNRWDLLVGYADACRWSTRLVEMTEALDEAIGIAGELEDPALVVGAASIAADGAVWPVRNYGTANAEVIAVMRRALEQLPDGDSEVRCRLLLLLAGELFYTAGPAEIDALAEESVAMAHRLGDRRLLLSVLTYGFSTRWRRGTVAARRAMATEAVALAGEAGDARSHLLARFLLASLRCGLGEMTGLEEEVSAISAQARQLRLYFLELATITQTQSWAAMRGDAAAVRAGTARLFELDQLISVPQKADALRGALLVPQMWGAEMGPPEVMLQYAEQADIPIVPALVVLLLRNGLTDLAADVWRDADYELGRDDWFAELHWSLGAEIAAELGERDLGAQLYERLLPLRGQWVISGTGPSHGPADAYLALAAAATGELGLATEHADVAAERCREWDIPQVARWLGNLRERHGF